MFKLQEKHAEEIKKTPRFRFEKDAPSDNELCCQMELQTLAMVLDCNSRRLECGKCGASRILGRAAFGVGRVWADSDHPDLHIRPGTMCHSGSVQRGKKNGHQLVFAEFHHPTRYWPRCHFPVFTTGEWMVKIGV